MLSIKLTEVLNHGESRHFRIPNFQRDYVWKYSDTEKLIDSMVRKFPIGNFLLLSCGNPNLKLNYFDLDIEAKAFNNTIALPQENECFYVLDGQQRITSLIRAFFNTDINRYYCLDLNVLLNMFKNIPDDDNLIVSFKNTAKFKIEKKNKDGNFSFLPLEEIINENTKNRNNMLDKFMKENDSLFIDSNDSREFFSYCISIFTELRNYSIPVQILDNKTTLESIVRIFETINNSGIKLSVFDLMVAKTFIDNNSGKFNLKEELENIQQNQYLKNLQGDTLLNAILYSHQIDNTEDGKDIYIISTKTNLLSLTRNDINTQMSGIVSSFEIVEKWIEENRIKSNSSMLNLKIMLSVCEFKYNIISNLSKNKEFNDNLKKFILFRAFDDKLYNRNVINSDVCMFKNIHSGKKYKDEFKTAIKYKEIKFEELLLVKKNSKEYNSYMCIFNENNTNDLYNAIIVPNSSEDHHIIPDSVIKDTFNEKDEIYKIKDSIANLVWTTKDTNNNISKDTPEKYFNNILDNYSLNDNKRNFNNSYIPIDPENKSSVRGYFSNTIHYIDFIKDRAKLLANHLNNYYKEYIDTKNN